jgi:hypothetical protein
MGESWSGGGCANFLLTGGWGRGERALPKSWNESGISEVLRASWVGCWDLSSLNAWEEKQPLGAAVGVELGIGELGIGSSWWIDPDLRRASGPASG